ncbi:DLW-39 family protein [Cellulomonas sp. ATA003]|nr:DLW-39 family protein [Cellulomonas sp. ATA003]WNB85581.1 DLW-39 family protein [Cellulomonas sp. ATA003]
MKKLLVLLLVAAAGFAVWRRVEEDRQDRDLWAEITDTVD